MNQERVYNFSAGPSMLLSLIHILDGIVTEGKPEIVRNRLPVAYNPEAPTPTRWLAFLDGLLYPEDIPTLQEYIGYCLIPSNKGQRIDVYKRQQKSWYQS